TLLTPPGAKPFEIVRYVIRSSFHRYCTDARDVVFLYSDGAPRRETPEMPYGSRSVYSRSFHGNGSFTCCTVSVRSENHVPRLSFSCVRAPNASVRRSVTSQTRSAKNAVDSSAVVEMPSKLFATIVANVPGVTPR